MQCRFAVVSPWWATHGGLPCIDQFSDQSQAEKTLFFVEQHPLLGEQPAVVCCPRCFLRAEVKETPQLKRLRQSLAPEPETDWDILGSLGRWQRWNQSCIYLHLFTIPPWPGIHDHICVVVTFVLFCLSLSTGRVGENQVVGREQHDLPTSWPPNTVKVSVISFWFVFDVFVSILGRRLGIHPVESRRETLSTIHIGMTFIFARLTVLMCHWRQKATHFYVRFDVQRASLPPWRPGLGTQMTYLRIPQNSTQEDVQRATWINLDHTWSGTCMKRLWMVFEVHEPEKNSRK